MVHLILSILMQIKETILLTMRKGLQLLRPGGLIAVDNVSIVQ